MGKFRKCILFDIDGTLLLTGGAGAVAFNRTFFRLYQLTEVWRDIRPDGRTDPSLVDELFFRNFRRYPTAIERREIQRIYHEEMSKALPESSRFRLMPGVAELLRFLTEGGVYLLGLATGNFESTAQLKLRHAKLDHHFGFGGFGSDHSERSQLTRMAYERANQHVGRRFHPDEVLLVGDTVHDIHCGKALGVTTVGVLTGSTTREELKTSRPDFILETLEMSDEVRAIFEY